MIKAPTQPIVDKKAKPALSYNPYEIINGKPYFLENEPGIDPVEYIPVEIINGIEFVMPAPRPKHQRIADYFGYLVERFLEDNPIGEAISAPCDVVFEPNTIVLQPDLIYFHLRPYDNDQPIDFAPDLVLEVLSPSTMEKDAYDKKAIYEKYGVKEYWIISPQLKFVEIFTLIDGKYKLLNYAVESGLLSSTVLEGFSVDCEKLFKRIS